MSEENTAALSRTVEAVRRLGAAIDRLEAASERAGERSGAGDLLLAGELRDARERQAEMEEATREVARRLDGAIDRLRTLLED